MNNYQHIVYNHFSFLKDTTTLDDLFAKSLPLANKSGYLIPVCQLHAEDMNLIKKLAEWRSQNSLSFPTQFTVTLEGTQQWLRNNVLAVKDRMLFLVVDAFGEKIGHLGFANAFNEAGGLEIDNVVRGVKNAHKGIMHLAMQCLLNWAEIFIAPKRIFLRVFNDNHHAVKFYQNLGFVAEELIPLRKQQNSDSTYISYQESTIEEADKYFSLMTYHPAPMTQAHQLISTAGPSISAREISYATDATRNGWNNNWNYYINRFEKFFCEYLGVKHALSTSSCTGALHIALAALGIGPGDEVIVPDITWVATANAVVYVGATPIFADVEKATWCMDPTSFESLITPRTKAVIPVHLYGHPARMDQITQIAGRHNLYIIEDAAPAIGAEWQQQKVGTFGDFATFSFQGAKLAVSGEGGMLVTNNPELYTKAYAIWDQGREPNTFWIKQNGLKYKMANVQAAIALGQTERVTELIAAKRRIFSWYAENLENTPHITLNFEDKQAYSIYWMVSIFLEKTAPASRDELRNLLKKLNIDTRPVFPAISQYPHWPKPQTSQPNAFLIGNQAINLPSGVCLKRAQVDYISKKLQEILA